MYTVINKALRGWAVVSVVFLTQIPGCSRVDSTRSESESRTAVRAPEPVRQNPADRIAEIERELSAPSTGTAGEADHRKTLKGELANLRATFGWQERAAASLQYGQQVQQLNQEQMRQQQLNLRYSNPKH